MRRQVKEQTGGGTETETKKDWAMEREKKERAGNRKRTVGSLQGGGLRAGEDGGTERGRQAERGKEFGGCRTRPPSLLTQASFSL